MFDLKSIYRAVSLRDALEALSRLENAQAICGGTDLLIKIRDGELTDRALVSIHDLTELQGVSLDENGDILIGPGSSMTAIAEHPLIGEHIPILAGAVDQVGGPQIRNVATIGGNICNGATSADSASTLFVLEAVLELTRLDGKRSLPIRDFYRGPGRVALEPGELLTNIRIPAANYRGFTGHYIKYAQRNAMDIATLGCAVSLRLSGDKKQVEQFRIAYGVAAPTPVRCPKTEEAARGQTVSRELIQLLGDTAVTEISPRTSWRASRQFRLQLAGELCMRAAEKAITLGGGTLDA